MVVLSPGKWGVERSQKALVSEAGLLANYGSQGSEAGGELGMLGSRSQQNNHEDRPCSHWRLPGSLGVEGSSAPPPKLNVRVSTRVCFQL